MRSIFEKYGRDKYSQNGEDGIIEYLLGCLGSGQPGVFAEFGANDGVWFSNTRALSDKGWTGTLIEADVKHFSKLIENTKDFPGLTVKCLEVTPENVNVLFPKVNLISLD